MPFKNNLILFRPEGDGGSGDGGGGEGGGSGSGSEGAGGQGPGNGGGQDPTPEALQRDLTETRKEAAKYRTERNAAQKRIEELEGSSKSELEKAHDRAKQAEEGLTTAGQEMRLLRARLVAPLAGITDPNAARDAATLLDWSKIEDSSDESALQKALTDLVKERPYLVGKVAGGGDGGEGGGRGADSPDMNSLIREAAGRG